MLVNLNFDKEKNHATVLWQILSLLYIYSSTILQNCNYIKYDFIK